MLLVLKEPCSLMRCAAAQTGKCDEHQVSPYNIVSLSVSWVMRIKKDINLRILSSDKIC